MPKLRKKPTQNDAIQLSKTRSEQRVPLPPIRIGPLNSQKGVRSQIAKLYRKAVRGEISPQDASKLTYCLHTLSKVIETETFEDRLKTLEETITIEHKHGIH